MLSFISVSLLRIVLRLAVKTIDSPFSETKAPVVVNVTRGVGSLSLLVTVKL